jgi:uncharacterized iron-regulated protein
MNRYFIFVAGAAVLAMAFSTQADQPRMQAALQLLTNAKAELQEASHDKGGHRARAQQLVNQAIAEVRAGIEYDRTHQSPTEPRR